MDGPRPHTHCACFAACGACTAPPPPPNHNHPCCLALGGSCAWVGAVGGSWACTRHSNSAEGSKHSAQPGPMQNYCVWCKRRQACHHRGGAADYRHHQRCLCHAAADNHHPAKVGYRDSAEVGACNQLPPACSSVRCFGGAWSGVAGADVPCPLPIFDMSSETPRLPSRHCKSSTSRCWAASKSPYRTSSLERQHSQTWPWLS